MQTMTRVESRRTLEIQRSMIEDELFSSARMSPCRRAKLYAELAWLDDQIDNRR